MPCTSRRSRFPKVCDKTYPLITDSWREPWKWPQQLILSSAGGSPLDEAFRDRRAIALTFEDGF